MWAGWINTQANRCMEGSPGDTGQESGSPRCVETAQVLRTTEEDPHPPSSHCLGQVHAQGRGWGLAAREVRWLDCVLATSPHLEQVVERAEQGALVGPWVRRMQWDAPCTVWVLPAGSSGGRLSQAHPRWVSGVLSMAWFLEAGAPPRPTRCYWPGS